MKISQKAMYRATETGIYTEFAQSQAPLNNATPRVTFLQNQQLVITHSMNPLMLPFLPNPKHQTRFLMQKKSKDEFSTK